VVLDVVSPPGRHIRDLRRRDETEIDDRRMNRSPMAQITQPVVAAPGAPLFNCTLRPLKVPNAAEITANKQKSPSRNSAS
jgi:hypothetical protein